jgi:hypothetical protein
MSLVPLNSNAEKRTWYGGPDQEVDDEEIVALVPKSANGNTKVLSISTAELIHELFLQQDRNWDDIDAHPKTNPKLPPENRFKRHRNYYIFQLNEFRHWWKTSRLLVRVSGGYEYCHDQENWLAMATYKVSKRRQAKQALKSLKAIGRGGPSLHFLNDVQKFTRTIRIILAFARGWEARVDNRFVEVLLAEAL